MTAPDDTQPHAAMRPIAPDPALESPAADSPVAASAPAGAASSADDVRDRIVQMLTTIYDPEIPVNIYEVGLVYDLGIDAEGDVTVLMTLTSPSCPVAESLPPEVEAKIGSVEGVRSVKVDLTWDPPWTPERMSEAAKLELGFL
jgi:FeS assembly SUF system protein